MKAKLVDSMPSGHWIYEIKFDGYRALALCGGNETRVLSRNQKDLGSKFPEVKDSIAALGIQDAIIDYAMLCRIPFYAAPSTEFPRTRTQHSHRRLCQRSAALLAPFSFTTDVSANTKEDILLSQISYLGEPQASLDSGQNDRVIASANPRFLVHRAQEGFDFRSSEVIDQTSGKSLIRYRQHPLDESGMLRCFQCRIMIKRTDRRQTGIAATCTLASVHFQIIQKFRQKRCVEVRQSEFRWRNAQALLRNF
jgi:hypothetical protein